tara:strand:+ start:560 stop:1612 length:1053 start_codon:yes stop_codon:yes gene_type:complete
VRILEKKIKSKQNIHLNGDDFANLQNLISGLYSPNKTFFGERKYKSFISANKSNETIPILLYVKKSFIFEKGKSTNLCFNRKIVGEITNEEFFKVENKKIIKKTFNFVNRKHPIIKKILLKNPYCLSGKIKINKNFIKSFYNDLKKIQKNNLKNSVAFSSRNIPHLGHEKIIQRLIKMKFKNIFIVYINSKFNYCNYDLFKRCYKIISKKFKKKFYFINLFLPSFKAGPNEALFQSMIIKKIGIQNFSIGRDHAGISNFYKRYESQDFLSKRKIKRFNFIFNHEPVKCEICKKIFFDDNNSYCKGKHNCKKNMVFFSGKKNISLLRNNNFKKLSKYINKDIINELKKINF